MDCCTAFEFFSQSSLYRAGNVPLHSELKVFLIIVPCFSADLLEPKYRPLLSVFFFTVICDVVLVRGCAGNSFSGGCQQVVELSGQELELD